MWITFILFVLHQLSQKVFHWHLPFIDSYFDPFAASVLGLFGLAYERKHLWGVQHFRFSWFEILLVVTCMGIVSEEVLPRLFPEFFRDPYDYLAFFAGGIYYYWCRD